MLVLRPEQIALLRQGRPVNPCNGGGKGSAPPPPDYGPIAASTKEAAEIAKQVADEDLAFRRQVYEESKPVQAELMALARQVAQQQLGIADANEQRASEQWQSYQTSYRPNELMTLADAYGQQYLGDADRAQLNALITGGGEMSDADRLGALQEISRRAEDAAAREAAARAGGEVNRAVGLQGRMLGRYGAGDPNRMAVMAQKLGEQQVLASVGASNAARQDVRSRQLGLRTGVANFGRNMPNTAGQAFGLATQAGSSATANQNAAFMSGLPYAQFASGGFGNQMAAAGLQQQGALGMGGLMNSTYGNQIAAYNAQQQAMGAALGGLGSGLGMFLGSSNPWIMR